MKVGIELEYEDEIYAINEAILNMPKELLDKEDSVLRKIGNVIKKNVINCLSESDVERRAKDISPSNFDGSRPYVHMKDDVKSKIKNDKNGNRYVSIHGGKMTGFKWHLLDQGHIARDGITFVAGNNFIGRAMAASEGDVNKIIDEMLQKVVE